MLLTNRGCTQGQGDAPYRMLYVDPNGSTGLPKTKEAGPQNKQIVQWWNQARTSHSGASRSLGGSLARRPTSTWTRWAMTASVLNKAPGQVSWAELLNTKWKGRVAVLNDPAIAMDDLGNAVKALGLMKIKDLGNMTRGEMDRLFKILTKYKKDGQFRAFWATFNESVNLMASKEVVIESMWSPAVAVLVAQGVDCRYAFPKEGIRGWCSAQGIPSHVTGEKLQAVYDYLNWMYEGWLGAQIMRQGYYIANGNKLLSWIQKNGSQGAPAFTPAEYAFWYLGKPAPRDLPGSRARWATSRRGRCATEGRSCKRSCKYTVWNSFYEQNVYQVKKFNEFLSA